MRGFKLWFLTYLAFQAGMILDEAWKSKSIWSAVAWVTVSIVLYFVSTQSIDRITRKSLNLSSREFELVRTLVRGAAAEAMSQGSTVVSVAATGALSKITQAHNGHSSYVETSADVQ